MAETPVTPAAEPTPEEEAVLALQNTESDEEDVQAHSLGGGDVSSASLDHCSNTGVA